MHATLRGDRKRAVAACSGSPGKIECGESTIQHFMMRLSSNLRRFRWLVFTGWLLALLPAIYLTVSQSGHLTGGGFDVPGSQSLRVHDELEAHYPDQGTSPLALVAAPRADASYEDMNAAADFLQQVARQVPDVAVVPNPAQPAPQPDRPYVVSLRLDTANNSSSSDVAKKLRASRDAPAIYSVLALPPASAA